MMKLAIRLNGGGDVGFGHATRCVALAGVVQKKYGWAVTFYVHSDPILETYLQKEHFSCVPYPPVTSEKDIFSHIAADSENRILLVDRLYPYAEQDLTILQHRMPICMLHNECEAMTICDAVIFPVGHLSDEKNDGYRSRMRSGGYYSGFEYVMLGAACLKAEHKPAQEYLSLASGASDPRGVLLRLLEWSPLLPKDLPVRAMFGNSFMWKDALQEWMTRRPASVTISEFSSEDFFASRFSVCAFGVSVYELMYHEIPFLTVAHIPKTAEGSAVLARKIGLPIDLGLLDTLNPEKFASAVEWMIQPGNEAKLRQKISGLVDGKGVDRVADILYNLV